MITATTLQLTQSILSNLTKDKQSNLDCLAKLESDYEYEVKELNTAVGVVDYGKDRIQGNGKADDQNIRRFLRIEALKKKYIEERTVLIQELERIDKLTRYIKTMNDDTGKALRWFYIGWDNELDDSSAGRSTGAKLRKNEIGDELGYERTEVAHLIREGEKRSARFLVINKLI